jgi:hypothetical protein
MDEQIFEFQWKVDDFAQGWFKINKGDKGVRNYFTACTPGISVTI